MAPPETRPGNSGETGNASFSPEDQRELDRQYQLFGRSAFAYLGQGNQNEKIAVVARLKQMVDDIANKTKTMDDFFALQYELMKNPANEFLEEVYPGLNVAGWRVVMALIDPLTYGKVIQSSSGIRAPISRRS